MTHSDLQQTSRRMAPHRTARGRAAAGLLAALALAACSRGDAADAAATAAPPAMLVGADNIAVLAADTLETGPAVSGTLTPEREAQVRAEAGGSVLRVNAEVGQQVPTNALLAQIEQKAGGEAVLSARTAVAAAQSSFAQAEREAQRATTLLSAGAVAERDAEAARRSLDAARAQVANARAQLAAAEQTVAGTRATAPFSGVVGQRAVNVGDVVAPGALLFTIVDPTTMRYEASVPAEQLGGVRVGAPVRFTVNGYPGRAFEGRVTRVSPIADPATRQVKILVSVQNAGGQLVGGLFAEGRVASERRAALVAPASAVNERGVSPVVFRVKNGVVESVPVTIALRDAQTERVALDGNLAAGDTLLVGAAMGITPGTPVRVGQPADSARPAAPVGGN